MSFSGTVKAELAKRLDPGRHCRIAELSALLSCLGTVEEKKGTTLLRVVSENEAAVRKCFTLLQKTFNIKNDIVTTNHDSAKKATVYSLTLSEPKVLAGTKMKPEAGGLLLEQDTLVTQRECCRRAFVRGAFLASGSMSDPRKAYHFEIVCQGAKRAAQLQDMIRSFHIDAKTVVRKKSHVVYVKEGAQIVDLLAVMGANIALMDLENIRILKEMRNTVNRKVNCETANINKTVNAAVKQMEDIRLVEQQLGLDSLTPGLAEIAGLRLAYPEASLKELGSMLEPPVGKSGVNHRLRKLSELAEGLRSNEEERV